MTHTKQEWRQGGGIHVTTIYDHLMNKVIAYTKDSEGEANGISKEEAQANAQRIVECVNGWDELNEENEVNTKFVGKLGVENAMLKVQKAELIEQVEKLKANLKDATFYLSGYVVQVGNSPTLSKKLKEYKQALK